MVVREVEAKSILNKSRIYDYSVNPYLGCGHRCRYCYAAFLKRFTGHRERWGEFVDVKVNAPELLAKEIRRKPLGRVWLSGVCDPYQPLEKTYGLTGECLALLSKEGWPITVQTKSSLVMRDIEILAKANQTEVGMTITTAQERMREIFEPGASPVKERIAALGALHDRGIRTFAMLAPILPGAEELPRLLAGKVDLVLLDRLNYHYADRLYVEQGLGWAKEERFFQEMAGILCDGFSRQGVAVEVLF